MAKKTYICKKIAVLLAILVLNQTIAPTVAYCLTSGPSQPEFSGFQQAGVTDMVDLFSGDFMYNVPLCDVDGFPINISYNANPRMDDEASWVGLGWSLNPGSISRSMRGLPDDFAGEGVTKTTSMAADATVGIDGAVNAEIFGLSKAFALSIGVGGALSYNTRRGFDFTTSLFFNPIAKIGDSNKALSTNIGLSSSSQNGLNMNVSVGLGSVEKNEFKSSMNLSAGLNSRQGLKSFTFQTPLPIKDPFLSGMASYMGAGSITHNFGPYSYTPTSSLPMMNEAFSFSGKGGGEIFGVHPNFKLGGFFSEQYLAYNTENQTSYGYLYLEDGQDNPQALLDYNSEVTGQIKENTPNLPLAYGTYDVFSVAGQGIGGAFRAVRNDVGLFRPAAEQNLSSSGNIGIELGGGNAVHGGGDIFLSNSSSTRGAWTDPASPLPNNLRFREGNPNYRNFYFKFSNDNSKFFNDIYENYGEDETLYLNHVRSGSELIPKSKWLAHEGGSYQLTGQVTNENEVLTNTTVSFLTGAEATEVGLDRQIMNYPDPNDAYVYGNCNLLQSHQPDPIDRVTDDAPAHHLSEFTIYQGDGARYVYGLPVKNISQKDVTFSAANDGGIDQTMDDFGLVTYTPNGPNPENSKNNNIGRDEYFESSEMPPYAHSYLLTSMLSADYVDKTGDGVSDDDLGTAIKINHHQHNSNFQWRIPYGLNSAQYHGGYTADDNDDRASYVYGEKEMWYMHSIESRTKVAQFFTSPREDGLGVNGENGGISTNQTVLKLDSIQVFTKAELHSNQASPTPLKTVHFTYDYSLCQGVPNRVGTGGKLTLKSIHFTYQNSDRGELSPYVFGYQDGPDYAMGLYNRWGFPQQNPTPGYPHVQDFPYVLQGDDEQSTANAGAWSLNEVTLPTGATIDVTYEPDDYAYVQNKRAGQMMRVEGFTNNASASPPSNDVNQQIYSGTSPKRYVVVDLPFTLTEGVTEMQQRYFEDVGDIYFNMNIEMTEGDGNFERIKGYFKIDTAEDIILHSSNDRVSIPVKYLEDSRGRDIQPIAFAGMQVLRLQVPEIIYPELDTQNPGVAFFKSIFNAGKEIRKLFKGFEYVAMKKDWSKSIDNNGFASWIRLANPTFKKFGGNSRVERVTISDNWTFDGPGGESTYGQRYEYTDMKEVSGVPTEISSGVAAYEPAAGGEENLMKQPLPYAEKYLLGPKNLFYSETPFGESLFPSASIGYSKVKVINIANDNPNLIRTKSGHTTNEFFTAKDFPTKVTTSQVLPRRVTTNPILKFLKIENKDLVSMSQGYTIELNDMHGKQSRTSTYDKNEQLLSSTTYKYQLEEGSGETKWLDNEVDLVSIDGTVETKEMGVEFDLWQETFKERNVTEGNGQKISGDFFMAFIFPVIVPTIFPNSNKEETGLSAAVTTKVIHRNGVLNTVEVVQDGSKIATENVAYDSKTGNVLINKTYNEHDDPIYSFTTPAYWAYPYMGHASENLNTLIEGVNIADGLVSNSEAQGAIRAGDELMVIIDGNIQNDRVYAIRSKTASQFTLIDRTGVEYTSATPVDLKVLRSGNRNMLGGSVLQTQTIEDPQDAITNNIPQTGVADGVLSASASTYKSDFPVECEMAESNGVRAPIRGVLNPYIEGGLGQWRPFQTYSPKNLRGANGVFTALSSSQNEGIYGTYDGVLENYFSGWVYNSSLGRWVCNLDTWILGEEITKYDRNGNALESFNALCIPTAAHFGYKNTMPTIVASNSTYAELYNENFEEYAFEADCDDADYLKHLEIFTNNNEKITLANLNSDHAHTGLHSLEIPANQSYYSTTSMTPCAEVEVSPRQICGTNFSESYREIIPAVGGGYMAVGIHEENSGASPSLQNEGLVAKLDENGVPQWIRLYGGNNTDEACQGITATNDGNYLVSGTTTQVTAGNRDIFAMKIDPQGNIIWQNSFQGSDLTLNLPTISAYCMETSDGSFVIAGRMHQTFTEDHNDSYVIKLNAAGILVWSRIFGTPNDGSTSQNEGINDLIETSDGNYVFLTGFRQGNPESALHEIGVFKLNTQGNILWEKGFGTGNDSRDNGANQILELANGTLVVSGWGGTVAGFAPFEADAIELRLDANGNKIVANGWSAPNGRFNRYLRSAETASGVVFSGWYNKDGASSDYDAFLYSQAANIDKVLDFTLGDNLMDMIETPDNGFAMAGYAVEGGIDQDLYFVKLDANGDLNDACPTTDLTWNLVGPYSDPVYNTSLVVNNVNQSSPVNLQVNTLNVNCNSCGEVPVDPVGVESITVETECTNCLPHQAVQVVPSTGGSAFAAAAENYETTCHGCLPVFTPEIGKDYLVSCWVANPASLGSNVLVSNAEVEVTIADESSVAQTFTFEPEGPAIEGWQRISGKVSISDANPAVDRFNISFKSTSNSIIYVDDIRIHPNICNAKSYVYDSYSARLMAELDENNYALFYEYDDEGLLVRIKRETEKGIVTIQEGRTVTKPNPQ